MSDLRRVLIVDDHPVVTETLSALVDAQEDLEVGGVAGDAAEALEHRQSLKVDEATNRPPERTKRAKIGPLRTRKSFFRRPRVPRWPQESFFRRPRRPLRARESFSRRSRVPLRARESFSTD